MPRFALTLAYDGSRFNGWQTQPGGEAAQDVLERALATIAGHPVGTICAGRTDAGVHALRQVVHFDSDAARPLSAWVRGVNSHLPEGLAVRSATQVADDFHARYGAARRRYRYLLYRSAVRHPLLARRAGWTFRDPDVARMSEAAALVVGEHDFSAFRSAECQAASPVRRLEELTLREQGAFVVFTFTGNAFLHHMIRNLMGALVAVGEGRRPPGWIGELLAGRDRQRGPATFAPDGLYFDGAQYDARFAVPSWGDDLSGCFA